jgi:hypothetical protein
MPSIHAHRSRRHHRRATLPSFLPAHSNVTKVVIDGTTYSGNVPNAQLCDGLIRQTSKISPVKGANNPSLNCGMYAQLPTMVVPANPGGHGAGLGRFWWEKCEFFRIPTCLTFFNFALFAFPDAFMFCFAIR